MGRMKGRGGRNRGNRGRQRNGRDSDRWDAPVTERANALYESYYIKLANVTTDEQKEEFLAALRRDLPNSFRFTGSRGHALVVQAQLKDHYIPEITSIDYEGQPVSPPTPLPWYPDDLAWQMTTPKNVIRKFKPFSSFQKFLVSETFVGNISRQEAVSMIPPLLMDIKPHMTVLDMCAAPGSKSAQLIEMIHSGEEARMRKIIRKQREKHGRALSPDGVELELDKVEDDDAEELADGGRSTGLVIANDNDYKRAHLLIHQTKRLNSPNLIVTNHDATMFPSLRISSLPSTDDKPAQPRYLKFDRILADVPCSGDGTCRKNINVWKDWNPTNALGLHTTQVRILVRALQMLKVGGRVVYSTCSMNPVENEAVVAAAIARCGGVEKVELKDCSDRLTGLIRTPGLKQWEVIDKSGRLWSSWQEVETHRKETGEQGLSKVTQTMFAPADSAIPLENCMRVYAHQQDTGAFFISVLEKRSEIKARPENGPPQANKKEESGVVLPHQPSVVDIVNELEAKKVDEKDMLPRLESADEIAPPTQGEPNALENPSAAERQNADREAPKENLSSKKRALDDAADVEHMHKRPAIREEIDTVAPRGEEDRQVHYPPPPGAVLELSQKPAPTKAVNSPKPGRQQTEEVFKYLDADNEELQKIYEFYGLEQDFPRNRFMVRNALGEAAKTIYYTSELAKEVLLENEGKGIKFIHCGVKMFVKQDVQRADTCRWRIQTDGLQLVEPWVSDERTIRLTSKSSFRELLVEMFPRADGPVKDYLGEISKEAREIGLGCCILRVDPSEGEDGFKQRMVLPLWRSLHSISLMLPKEERRAMLLRLYNEDVTPVDSSKLRKDVKAEGGDEMPTSAEFKEEEVMDGSDDEGGVALANEGQDLDIKEELKGGDQEGATMIDNYGVDSTQ